MNCPPAIPSSPTAIPKDCSADTDRGVSGIFDNHFPAGLSLFRKFAQAGDNHCQELKDNRSADIRHDSQCKDRDPRKGAA